MPAPTPFDVIYSPFLAGVLPAFAVDPDEGELIPVSFNPTYLPYVVGAIKALVQPALYKGATDIELQLNRANLLLSMFNDPNLYQRPFYDDDEQMDDSTLPASPWYEQVSDWIITLFLAITFTPNAAIVYITTIPRLRLAFRTGNIGTIVHVLIDDILVWTGDTHSATEGMLETIIDVPALPGIRQGLLPGQHELKVVHAGTQGQKLEVIRGDLRPHEMTTLLRMSGPCQTIQYNLGDGVWHDLVDLASCISSGVATGIQDALNNGEIAPPSQTGASGTVPVHDCKTYNVTLRGNERWISPNPVEAGYTVITQNAQGAWADTNSILSEWSCPSGTAYTLGNCGTYRATAPTDPLQSAAHMRLIGYCNTIYMDMYNQTYIVPNGTPPSNFTLQANDGDLSDNQGSITLKVTICNYSQWCYEFDFTVNDGGWYPNPAYGADRAVYEPGIGWASMPGSGGRVLDIKKDIAAGSLITEVRYWWHTDIAPDNIHGYPYYDAIGGWIYNGQDMSGQWYQNGQRESDFLGCLSGNGTGSGNGNGAHYWTTKARVTGIGVNPFGTSNC